MIHVPTNTFILVCQDLFGEQYAKDVCLFYSDVILPGKMGTGRTGTQYERHLKKYIKLYGAPAILTAILQLSKRFNDGTLKRIPINYFETVLENQNGNGPQPMAIKKTTPGAKPIMVNSSKKNKKASALPSIVPTKQTKITDSYELDYMNWDYTCTCGVTISAKTKECPNCKRIFNWSPHV